MLSAIFCCTCQTWGWNRQRRWAPDVGSGPRSLRAFAGEHISQVLRTSSDMSFWSRCSDCVKSSSQCVWRSSWCRLLLFFLFFSISFWTSFVSSCLFLVGIMLSPRSIPYVFWYVRTMISPYIFVWGIRVVSVMVCISSILICLPSWGNLEKKQQQQQQQQQPNNPEM